MSTCLSVQSLQYPGSGELRPSLTTVLTTLTTTPAAAAAAAAARQFYKAVLWWCILYYLMVLIVLQNLMIIGDLMCVLFIPLDFLMCFV